MAKNKNTMKKKIFDVRTGKSKVIDMDDKEYQELIRNAEIEKSDYKRNRQMQYPNIGDQLDSIWRAIEAINNSKDIPKQTMKMMNSILEIKKNFPKK